MDQRGKVIIRNRKSDRNEGRVFGNGNGTRGYKVRVSAQGCTECNTGEPAVSQNH